MGYCPGYCPQFDAVFEEMTGRENLRFFSKLRGIEPERAAATIEALAHALGFSTHLDKRVHVLHFTLYWKIGGVPNQERLYDGIYNSFRDN